MKLKNNQNGFGVIQALLMLVIVGIVGFTGWYVYSSNKESEQLLSGGTSEAKFAKNKTETKIAKTDPYAGWKEYCSDKGGLCFKYPSDWTLSNDNCGPMADVPYYVVSSPSGAKVSYEPQKCMGGSGTDSVTEVVEVTPSQASDLQTVSAVMTDTDPVVSNKKAYPYLFISSNNPSFTYPEGDSFEKGSILKNFATAPAFIASKFNATQVQRFSISYGNNSFSTPKEAKAWLASADARTIQKILVSTYYK